MKAVELIMPFYERGSVCDALLKGERFSVQEACAHAQAALRGLGELHETLGILHRDFKSSNVLLSDDTELVKLGDLGIAVRMEPDGSGEAFPHVQLYTPPEAHQSRRHDRRADIYGVGLFLYEMVNGRFPYEAYSVEVMEKRLTAGLPALKPADLRYGPHVPPRLRRAINKATAPDPTRRYPTAQAMSAALASVKLIDWRQIQQDETTTVWEGTRAGSHRRYRVEAARKRDGTWRLKGLTQKNSWRRAAPDVTVAQLVGSESTAFFDHLVDISAAS